MTFITDLFQPRQGGVALADQIDASGDCWEWTGSLNSMGYGKARHRNVHTVAHRVIWECLVGPIPAGLVLDHMCRNILCVNPDHLDPVTQAENLRRDPTNNANKKRCLLGHLFTEENTRYTSRGWRVCRECARRRAREYYYKDLEKNRTRAREYQRRTRNGE